MTENKHPDMASWWQSPMGQTLAGAETELLNQLSSAFYGSTQLQLGGSDMLPALNKLLKRTLLSSAGDVNAKPEALPFKCHSIDNLMLLHVLEFHTDPHQVLREAERVLTADGKLLLFCFNPISLWGLQRLFSWQDVAPWHGHFFTQTRIQDWLALLNFEVIEQHRLFFRPTFTSEKWMQRTVFMERWGKRLWPYFGSVNLLVATKRTIPLNPLRSEKLRAQFFPGPRLINKPITRDNPNG